MRTPAFLSDHLRELLRVKKIATLPELKQALGTTVDITVFRKLKELSYHSSYSHRGRYYTLGEIPQFAPQGLWSFHEVWFSRWGNLVTTLKTLVSSAPQGYFANELQQLLHVEVKDALLQLRLRKAAIPQGEETYILCRTSGRKEKEKAIRNRSSNSMETALKGLEKTIAAGRLKDRNKMERRLGQDSGPASAGERSVRRGA